MNTNEMKQILRKETSYLTDGWDGSDREYLSARMRNFLQTWVTQHGVDADEPTLDRVVEELCDDFRGYGPIQGLLEDPHVTEIMISGPDKIFVERDGRKTRAAVRFDDVKHLQYIVDKMIAPSGRRVDASMPCADFSLAGVARVNVTLPPLAADR